MKNRLEFFGSISGITDPRMVIIFYDQFLVLYHLFGQRSDISISIDTYSDTAIRFSVLFSTAKDKKEILTQVPSGNVVIYGKPISVFIQDVSVRQLVVEISR